MAPLSPDFPCVPKHASFKIRNRVCAKSRERGEPCPIRRQNKRADATLGAKMSIWGLRLLATRNARHFPLHCVLYDGRQIFIQPGLQHGTQHFPDNGL